MHLRLLRSSFIDAAGGSCAKPVLLVVALAFIFPEIGSEKRSWVYWWAEANDEGDDDDDDDEWRKESGGARSALPR